MHKNQLTYPQVSCHNKSCQKHQRAKSSEQMHGTLAEAGDEADGQHVKISFHEPVEAVFGDTVFARPVLHNLLANLSETRFLGQQGYVPVHLSVDLYAPYHFAVIGFELSL